MVKGLTNGTTYCFVIVRGRLPYVVSNIASATPAARPGAPTGLTPIAGNGQVTLSWTAPASDGGSQVSSYNVFEGTTADLSGSAPVTNVTGTTVTLPALTNGTTYYFWVTAVNGIGEGPPSNEVSAVPLTVPGAPTGLTPIAGNGQVTLSWTAPASDGGSQVSGYNVFEGTTADLSRERPGHQRHRHHRHAARPDQRDHVLLRGGRGQHRGPRPPVGRGVSRPGDRAGGTHRADRDSG